MLEEILETLGATARGWEVEAEGTYGLDANLIAPCGDTIEQDGQCSCPEQHISPLRSAGLI